MEPEGSVPHSQVPTTCSHQSMARPQVADEGTASSREGSCEYIEYPVADGR